MLAQRMVAEQGARLKAYKRAREYYQGNQKQPLEVKVGQANDNVIVNMNRLIIDKGAAFLFGKDVVFELQEGDTTPEEEYLDALWKRNQKMTFLLKAGTSGGIYGHVFVKIMPEVYQGIYPRLVNIEPEYVTVIWDGADIETVYEYRIQWTAINRKGQGVTRRQRIMLDDSGVTWSIINEVNAGNKWEADSENEDVTWPYAWPPMIDCQNMPAAGQYYGWADMEEQSEQDAINYVASKIQRILRFHAHPKTVASGMKNQDLSANEDEVLFLPGVGMSLRNMEMQSDLGSALQFLDRLIVFCMKQGRVPNLDPASMNIGALSGFALQVLYGDLLEKTEAKRRTYGDMLVELNRRLLDMNGMGDDNYSTIHWSDPLPENEQERQIRDAFEMDYKLASRETVQARRGLDAKTEAERVAAQKVTEGNIGAELLRNFSLSGETEA